MILASKCMKIANNKRDPYLSRNPIYVTSMYVIIGHGLLCFCRKDLCYYLLRYKWCKGKTTNNYIFLLVFQMQTRKMYQQFEKISLITLFHIYSIGIPFSLLSISKKRNKNKLIIEYKTNPRCRICRRKFWHIQWRNK